MPDHILAGYSAEGRIILCIHWGSVVEFVIGGEEDRMRVLEWQMTTAQDRRARWLHEWARCGYECYGVEQ